MAPRARGKLALGMPTLAPDGRVARLEGRGELPGQTDALPLGNRVPPADPGVAKPLGPRAEGP